MVYCFVFIINNEKGISSVQLAKELGITQKTAWFMIHRIREAITGKTEPLEGIVEIDETYIGGKEANKHADKRQYAGRGVVGKECVPGMIQRQGKVTAFHIKDTKAKTLENYVKSYYQG